jgi:hypothetical protein
MVPMTRDGKRLVAFGGVVAVVAASVGVATAAGVAVPIVHPTNGDEPFAQRVASPTPDLTASLSVLVDTPAVSEAVGQRLRDQMGTGGSPALAAADFDAARSVSVDGLTAYVIPSGDEACLIEAVENGVLTGTCSSLDAIRRGRSFVLRPVSSSEASVVALVADGQPAPTVVAADGTRTPLPVDDNVAAGTIDAADSLQVGDDLIPADPPKPSTGG